MREVRIYQAGEYQCDQYWELSPDAGQHVGVVLRMQAGDPLTLFNGRNQEYAATIFAVKKKKVTVFIHSVQEVNRESPMSIHLAQALSKGDKMEWIIQKAVELGVQQVTPLITERSVIKMDEERWTKKKQQWQAIAIAACEQSGRTQLPLIADPLSFHAFIKRTREGSKWIIHPHGNKSWRDYEWKASSSTVLVGPEGGFSEQELTLALQQDFAPLVLGPRILRTETAAISVLSLLQAVSGDL